MKPRPSSARFSLPLASAIATLLAAQSVHAASGTWISNSSSNWTTAGNWSSNIIADGAGFTANFTGVNITADRTVTLAADRTIGNITFTDLTTSSHNLIISGGNILTLDVASGAPLIDVTQTGRTLTISSVVAGNDGLQKNGLGTLLLQGANTFTGATTVSAGILAIQNYAGLDNTSSIAVSGGTSILEFRVVGTGATSDAINKALNLNGTLRTAGGTSANTLALTWDGNITLAGASTINNHGNGSIDVNGQVDLAANTLTFQADQTGARIDGKIIGSGGLIKTGAQTLTITGANTYTGATNISTGSLTLGSTGALGTTPGVDGTSGITIGNGASLRSAITGVVVSAPIGITTAATISSNIAGSGTSVRSMTLGGAITGTGNVTFSSDNGTNSYAVTVLNAASTYVGNTTITASVGNTMSIVRLGIDNALPIATQLTIAGNDGTAGRFSGLDLRGFNQEIAGLTGGVTTNRTLQITNSLSTTPTGTLTINTPISTSFTFAGRIGNGTAPGTLTGANFNLEKKGAGTQILTGLNDFTGFTKVSAGILSLGNAAALRNSAFDTSDSILGDATNGLSSSVTTLTLGGLTGSNSFASRFTTTGGYAGLTALTLNPGTGVTNSYAADIGDGATGMNLNKSGAGTQILTVAQSYTGTTTSTAGALVASTTVALPGFNVAGRVIFNGGAIGGQIGGAGWTTGEVDTLLANATKTSGALGIDTSNDNLTQWTSFTTTNLGPLGLNKLGANDLTLNQANTFTGATTVTQGTLTLTNALALQNSSLVTTGAGTVVLSGLTTLNLAGLSGATGNLATVISTGYGGVTAINLTTPTGTLLSYGGNITEGTGTTLTKSGAGIQTLTGMNDYTGVTQIDGGILVFGNKAAKASATATAAAAGTIGLGVKTADAAFYSEIEVGDLFNSALTGFSLDAASGVAIDTTAGSFNQTVALNAARSLTKLGGNTLTLSTANTYSGATSLLNGTLSVTNNTALGTTAGATTIHGGNGTTANTFSLSAATTDLTIAENINFAGNASGRAQLSHQALSRFHTLSGAIDVTSDTNLVQFSVTAGSTDSLTAGGVTISGDITGTFTNGAALLLRGGTSSGVSAANFITGNITLTGVDLVKTDANTWTIGGSGKTYSSSSNGITASNGVLKMGSANYLSPSTVINMGAATGGTTGKFDLNGFDQTVAGISQLGSSGAKEITNTGAAAVLTVNNALDYSSGTLVSLTGSLGLIKDGVGKLTLAANNTYTGTTTVTAGSLIINGAIASTSVVVNGSLAGSGTMAAATLSGSGSINPGNSPGILTAAAVDPSGGLDFNFEFTAANAQPTWSNSAASGNDVMRLTGGTPFLTALGGSNVMNIFLNVGSLTEGDVFTGGFYTDQNTDFIGSVSGGGFNYFIADGGGTTNYGGTMYSAYTGTFGLATVSQSADFGAGVVSGFTTQFTVIPEPNVAALLGSLGAFALLRRRRN